MSVGYPVDTRHEHDGQGQRMGSEITFSISDAARVCGVSRSAIRRLLDAGTLPGAYREAVEGSAPNANPWRVPIADLLAAGLVPNRPADNPGASVDGSEPEVVRLRHELEIERSRRIAAENIAAERDRVIVAGERALAGLEMALRSLGPGAVVTPVDTTTAAQEPILVNTTEIPAPVRRWWWPRGARGQV